MRYCIYCGRIFGASDEDIHSIYGICSFCSTSGKEYPVTQDQFNYECPDCHGKFNSPAYMRCKDYYSETYFMGYGCPFCKREMRGL